MGVDKILNGTTSRVKISGLLLVPCACEGRIKKIGLMNAWLRGWCVGDGGGQEFRFLDHWDRFCGRAVLYKRDRLHLIWMATNMQAGTFTPSTTWRSKERRRSANGRADEKI